MDKRGKKELITGIKDFLRDFEEPYNHGEWKRFERYRKKNKRKPIPLFLKLAGIAASLFVMVYASVKYLPLIVMDGQQEVPEVRPPGETPAPEADTDSIKVDTAFIDPLSVVPALPVRGTERNILPSELAVAMDENTDAVREGQPIAALPARGAAPVGNDRIAAPHIVSGIEPVNLVRPGGRIRRSPVRKKSSGGIKLPGLNLSGLNLGLKGMHLLDVENIRFGANVSPAFTDKGVAFGGGISARFPITDRIAAEIGISYSRMKVGHDRTVDKMNTVATQLAGTRDITNMVSIPVSLAYSFSESFAASVGLTPFRAVNGRRIDILQTNRWVSGGNSPRDSVGRILSERREVGRPDTVYRGNTYWGFIQLSGYYSPTFLRRYNLVVAPYIGIPIGGLRNDRNRWLHGGVSLRFYFTTFVPF